MEKSLSGIERVVKSVRADSIRPLLVPVLFERLDACIQETDWVFESVAEDYQAKLEINNLIASYRQPGTIVSTGLLVFPSLNFLKRLLMKVGHSILERTSLITL